MRPPIDLAKRQGLIRTALGAPQGEIVRMMVQQGMTIVLAGVAVGLGAAFRSDPFDGK